MPRVIKIKTPALASRRGPSLEKLIFHLGGVAGAVRRIVHRSPSPLTMEQIRRRLEFKHPQLRPATNQVEDVVTRLIEQRRVVVKANERKVRTYSWSPRPAVPSQQHEQLPLL
jgi:hypothetical protein